jgi:hypothetical protein
MKIDSTGRVFLTLPGTTNQPNLSLNVGGIGDPGNTSWVTPRIDFTGSSLASAGTTFIGATGGFGGRSLVFATGGDAAGTERMRIDSSGRVGIGTTSPTTAASNVLHVASSGPGSNALVRVAGNNGTGVDLISGGDSTGYVFNRDNAALVFGTNDTERARIDSSGRLLVGTSSARNNFYNSTAITTPQLQVEGTTYSNSSCCLVNNNTSTDGGFPILVMAKSAGSSVGSNTAVSNGHVLGQVTFQGNDGTEFVAGADITAYVDGTPGTNDMPGRLVFSTTSDGASSPTERMRITQDAYVRLASGTGGIQFNGDTAAVNALDDYEEGTWTPVLSFGGGSVGITYTTSPVGYYTRVGRLVHVQLGFKLSNKGSSTGDVNVGGLPFTVNGVGSFNHSSAEVNAHYLAASGIIVHGLAAAGTNIEYRKVNDSTADTRLTDSDFTNAVGFYHSMVYFT